MQDAPVDQSMLQLVLDQLEELVFTLIEEIRERPGVAAAIFAAVCGAIVRSILAARSRPSRSKIPPESARRGARRISDAAELAGLGLRLLENPIVRAYVRSAVA